MAQAPPSPLADAVRELLEESGLSLARFARQVGLSRKQIERILAGETTRPRDDTLRKIAQHTDRPAWALIAVADEGSPLPPPATRDDRLSEIEYRLDGIERTLEGLIAMVEDIHTLVDDEFGPVEDHIGVLRSEQ